MGILKLALVVAELLLVIKLLQGYVVPTSSYEKIGSFYGEIRDEFPTANLVRCLKTCDRGKPWCQASRYNVDNGQCQRLANGTIPVTSDDSWTVFQRVRTL